VGYDEGGQLTEAVRRRPYSVVLFDEIEKAHPEVFNVFLQLLDDGRLTNGQGRTVDFRNTVITMTSNIGSQVIMDVGDDAEVRRRVMEALRSHFRPEFLNRVDETVIFHRLEKEHLRDIAQIQLNYVRDMLSRRNITIALTPEAIDLLIEKGYDPIYGARPLKRVIQRRIVDPLALKVIQNEVREGDHVVVDALGDVFTFDAMEIATPEQVAM